MAEGPLGRLARLLGGVVLTQGRIPHQVLGQLLLFDTDEVAIAGATVVLAATSRQRNVVAQAALRTAAPVLAVRALLRADEERLARLRDLLDDRQEDLMRLARIRMLQEERKLHGSVATPAVLEARGRPAEAALVRALRKSDATAPPEPPPPGPEPPELPPAAAPSRSRATARTAPKKGTKGRTRPNPPKKRARRKR